jgi:hypothetical protein
MQSLLQSEPVHGSFFLLPGVDMVLLSGIFLRVGRAAWGGSASKIQVKYKFHIIDILSY